MKNSADLGECYPPRPSASVDNTLLDLQNSSYPTSPHSIIAKPSMGREWIFSGTIKLLHQVIKSGSQYVNNLLYTILSKDLTATDKITPHNCKQAGHMNP